jgi:hypothetical protein
LFSLLKIIVKNNYFFKAVLIKHIIVEYNTKN